MAFTWAAQIDRTHTIPLGRLRLLPNVELGEDGETIWLRGQDPIDEIRGQLLTVPHIRLFHLAADNSLRQVGKLLSDGKLPSVKFAPLHLAIMPEWPVAAFPTGRAATVPVRLERGGDERPPSILMTDLKSFAEFAIGAPEVRLKRWMFAASPDGRAIIRGEPIPSLPGQTYWESHGVAIPIGWSCRPHIDSSVLAELLAVSANEIVLLHPEAEMERIPGDAFVHVSRSAVRSTMKERDDA